MDKIKLKCCNRCKIIQRATNFYNSKKSPDGLQYTCKTCHKEQIYQSYKNNKYQYKLRRALTTDIQRIIALQIYSNSNMKCALCGEDKIDVLTIDHITGGGNQHRKKNHLSGGESFYKWLCKNNFPQGFRVLCRNCNHLEGLRINSNVKYNKWGKINDSKR